MTNTPEIDDLDELETKVRWKPVVLSLVFLLSAPFLGYVFQLSHFGTHSREFISGLKPSLVLYFLFYFIALYVVLILPLTQLVWSQFSKDVTEAKKILLALALLTPPLLSFGYYIGRVQDWGDFTELLFVVVPSVLLGGYFFIKTEKGMLFALYLAVATFIPFFVLNDILGPFPAAVPYFPRGNGFLILRALVPMLTIAGVFYYVQKHGVTYFRKSEI